MSNPGEAVGLRVILLLLNHDNHQKLAIVDLKVQKSTEICIISYIASISSGTSENKIFLDACTF